MAMAVAASLPPSRALPQVQRHSHKSNTPLSTPHATFHHSNAISLRLLRHNFEPGSSNHVGGLKRMQDSIAVRAGLSTDLYEMKGSPAEGGVAESDLLVVGPGVLGSLIGQYWLQVHDEGCKVVGQTNTTNRHAELASIGITPVTKGEQSGEKYPFVVFSAPPSGSEDYVTEVRAAAQRWNGEGSLLFTSSSGVYNVSDNGPCDESNLFRFNEGLLAPLGMPNQFDFDEPIQYTSPVFKKGDSPRTDRLLNAEEEVLKVGGNVVRLAGLYTRDRGAHTFWLQKGTVDARPDHFLNVIHYEDAADLCVTILRKKSRGQVFMGCDNTPVSRQDIMDAMMQSDKFEGEFKGFTKTDGPLGKKMNNNATREMLGWQPKYGSFAGFVASL